MKQLTIAFLAIFTAASPAYAGLFADDGARQMVKELQTQVTGNNDNVKQIRQTQQQLEKRLGDVESISRNQAMDSANQSEQLNQQISQIKGQLEVINHQLQTMQDSQKQFYNDLDARLRKLESQSQQAAFNPTPTATPSGTTASNPFPNTAALSADETSANGELNDFENAQSLTKAGKYKEAFTANNRFLQTYPNSSFAPDAMYNLGYTQFALKNYKAAASTQSRLAEVYAEHPKAPDALLMAANAQIQLSDVAGAKKTLSTLLSKYPNSAAAPQAKKRLTALEAIR